MNKIVLEKSDVVWSFIASFLKMGASLLLLPLILRMLPAEAIGIWTVFMSIIAFVNILDFGFAPTFTRNVASVYSGLNSIQSEGYGDIADDGYINYHLLKGLIKTMKWFYFRVGILVLILLSIAGTLYLQRVMISYSLPSWNIYLSWAFLVVINSYKMSTLYYESLLIGCGRVKKAKQIQILSQLTYLLVGASLIILGHGLLAIVFGQGMAVIVHRIASFRAYYDKSLSHELSVANPLDQQDILKAVYPNAFKVGLTSIAAFFTSRGTILIGSLYLSLESIANYGVTFQLVAVISSLSMVYLGALQPQIIQLMIVGDIVKVREIYARSQKILLLSYVVAGTILVVLGELCLKIIDSSIALLSSPLISLMVIISLLESNHALAATILTSKNEIPYYKAAILAGTITLVFLFFTMGILDAGVIGLVVSPGVAQAVYQNWKWPKEANKLLGIWPYN